MLLQRVHRWSTYVGVDEQVEQADGPIRRVDSLQDPWHLLACLTDPLACPRHRCIHSLQLLVGHSHPHRRALLFFLFLVFAHYRVPLAQSSRSTATSCQRYGAFMRCKQSWDFWNKNYPVFYSGFQQSMCSTQHDNRQPTIVKHL